MNKELSIIIVNYNTFQLSCNCIQSLYDKIVDIEFEVVLVDNASTECDARLFLEKFPEITLIVSDQNLGFAGGNNLGVKKAHGKYLLLLNSDTELINNAPGICLDYLKRHPEVGLVAAQLQYPDGKIQHNARRFRTIGWELLEIFPVYKLLPKHKQETLMLHHYFDHQRNVQADWVWGTFMMFEAAIVPRLPHKELNSMFFMYGEDVLWCWEIKQLGYEIHFLATAKTMHIHRGSGDAAKWKRTRNASNRHHAIFMKQMYNGFLWYVWKAIFGLKQWGILQVIKMTGKHKL